MEFHDFLLDHRIPVNALYAGGTNFPSVQQAELQRLWARGQRVWEPSDHFGAGRNGALGYPTAKLEEFVQAMNKSVSMALDSGEQARLRSVASRLGVSLTTTMGAVRCRLADGEPPAVYAP